MKKNFITASALVAAMALFSTCATNPVSGKKEVALISEAQEIAMGQEADPQIIQEFGLYADSALQRYIREKGQQMAAISHRPNLNYTFRVLDSDVMNAFAVPGGYVYLTRGIMANMNNEAQFAGVLGHEIGHVAARHTVQQQTKQTLGQIGIIGAMIIKPELAQFGEQIMQGAQLLFLKYDRNAEKQSDELGVQYSSRVGWDAHEMAKFFLTLERDSELKNPEGRLPEYLSTHPDPGNRYTTVTRLASDFQKANNITDAKVGRDRYLQLIDGIVYGEDPRQGFRENNVFYHPELKFQFNTPVNWRYKNSPSQVQFAPADGSAMMFLTAAQAANPQAAAQAFAQQAKLVVQEANQTTVNGLPAYYIVADQMQQNQQTGQTVAAVRALAYFVQYNNLIYMTVGATTPQAFSTYAPVFLNTMQSFRQLTDQAKINIKPERIKIVTVPAATTLQQALLSNGIAQNRLKEMAITNGMELTDRIPAGTKIKVLVRR